MDPGLVLKVRAAGRLTPEDWNRRGLELLTEGEHWDYVVLSPGTAPPKVGEELARYASGPDEEGASAPLGSFFGAIEAVEPYGPEDRLGTDVLDALSDTALPVDIVIWPASSSREAAHRVDQVVSAIRRLGGEVTAADRRDRSPTVRALVNRSVAVAIATVPVVETIKLPLLPYVDPSDWRDLREDDLRVERRDGALVGVLDDAIAAEHPLLRGVVEAAHQFPPDRAWQQPGEHGTMVAGLAAYGDFEKPLRDGAPFVLGGNIVQGRVIEPKPMDPLSYRFPPEQQEYLTIEQAIAWLHDHHGVRVFVLCVTEIDPYSGPRVSVLTERLDDLVRDRDIVVVVPTGNHNADAATATMASGHHAVTEYPSYLLDEVARVSEPATAALALTVGSVARSDGPATIGGGSRLGYKAIAPRLGMSPFTRSGPGAYKGVKPDLVHFGGNWVVRSSGDLALADAGTSVISLAMTPDGRLFGTGNGTSYAAPRVARVAADVLGEYADASANLVRALVGLSARVSEPVKTSFGSEAPRVSGHGIPATERAIASTRTRVVLMGEFTVATDTVAIHPVPIPQAFTDGRAWRTIRVALAFDPPVRRTRREYLAGEMDFDLLRATDVDEVASIYQKQDPGEPLRLPKNRRRLTLEPGSRAGLNSTLIIRQARSTLFQEDDGDTYFLAVTHRNRPWASDGDQTYALAVEFAEEDRVDVDLYADLRQRVAPRVRIRAGSS